jgi:hypothetical protein
VEATRIEEQRRNAETEARVRRLEGDLAKAAGQLVEAKEEVIQLKTRLSKVPASKGQAAEMDFSAYLGTFDHLRCGDKLPRHGDYEVVVKAGRADGGLDPIGEPVLADVKDVAVTDARIQKLVEDAKARKRCIAAMVVPRDELLRPEDKKHPLTIRDGVFILATTRDSFPRDVFLLAPLLEVTASGKRQGGDAESRIAHLVSEVSSRLSMISKIAGSARKARKGVEGVSKEIDHIEGIAKQFADEIRAICTVGEEGQEIGEPQGEAAEPSVGS